MFLFLEDSRFHRERHDGYSLLLLCLSPLPLVSYTLVIGSSVHRPGAYLLGGKGVGKDEGRSEVGL